MNNRINALLPLTLTYFLFAILLNSVGTVILQMVHQYAISKESASLLEGFKDLPIAFASFFFASFIPRLGYKVSLQLGLVLIAIACMLMPVLPGFLMTKILFFSLGVSFALVKISVYASIGTLANTKRQHASILNTIEGWFMVGVLVGNWLFAWFIYQSPPHSNGWLNVYWLLGGLCLLNMLLLQHSNIPQNTFNMPRSKWSDFKNMLKLTYQPLVLAFVLSTFIYVLIEQSISNWLPTFNFEILHVSKGMSVQLAGLLAAMMALGRLSAGYALKKIDTHTLLSVCIIAIAALLLTILPATHGVTAPIFVSWHNAPIAAYLLPVTGFFLAPIYPAINSAMLSALPVHQHASMTGLIVIFSALGGTTGSFITGHLFQHFGGQLAFYLLLIPLFALYMSMYRFNRTA